MNTYIGFKAEGMGFDAHLTVLYTGPLDKDRTDAVKSILSTFAPINIWVERKGIELFGPENNIPVVTVYTSETLINLRQKLLDYGIPNASKFKEWNPHITLAVDPNKIIKIPAAIRLVNLGFY